MALQFALYDGCCQCNVVQKPYGDCLCLSQDCTECTIIQNVLLTRVECQVMGQVIVSHIVIVAW